jgi:hypothetical protein
MQSTKLHDLSTAGARGDEGKSLTTEDGHRVICLGWGEVSAYLQATALQRCPVARGSHEISPGDSRPAETLSSFGHLFLILLIMFSYCLQYASWACVGGNLNKGTERFAIHNHYSVR